MNLHEWRRQQHDRRLMMSFKWWWWEWRKSWLSAADTVSDVPNIYVLIQLVWERELR